MSYTELKSYQQATIIYDFTVEFCKRYIARYSRTTDQMTQAARSGKQNIAEGSQISRTSRSTEIKLISVARASFQEILEDYQDFLRQNGLAQWEAHGDQSRKVRAIAFVKDRTYKSYKTYLENQEDAANAMICLIHQTNYLLDQQIRALEDRFVKEGGYRENLLKRRLTHRFGQ